MMTTTAELTPAEREHFVREGYLLRREQISENDIERLFEHFAAIHARGTVPGCFEVKEGADPLARWPRMMHPHRFDPISRGLLLDARLMGVVEALYGEPALAAQSMYYWKPPGARGQALHQDDFYLRTRPGDCLAAWVSLDPADSDNGGLRVVPRTHLTTLQCPHQADERVSMSAHEVDLDPGWEAVPVDMGPGDILFFPGRLIHGSLPNRSADRWRRSFICHYVPASAAECARWYQPLLDSTGNERYLAEAGPESDPCGGPEYPIA